MCVFRVSWLLGVRCAWPCRVAVPPLHRAIAWLFLLPIFSGGAIRKGPLRQRPPNPATSVLTQWCVCSVAVMPLATPVNSARCRCIYDTILILLLFFPRFLFRRPLGLLLFATTKTTQGRVYRVASGIACFDASFCSETNSRAKRSLSQTVLCLAGIDLTNVPILCVPFFFSFANAVHQP